jgi:hypothetical protein
MKADVAGPNGGTKRALTITSRPNDGRTEEEVISASSLNRIVNQATSDWTN